MNGGILMGSKAKVYNTSCPYHDDCAYRKTCPPDTVLMNERDIGDDDSVECQVNLFYLGIIERARENDPYFEIPW